MSVRYEKKKNQVESSLNFIDHPCDSLGEENARSSSENERRGTEGQGKVRERAAGNQSVQSKIHGGHDSGVREVPGNGSPEIAVLQRRALWYSQMPQYFSRPSVSNIFVCLFAIGMNYNF